MDPSWNFSEKIIQQSKNFPKINKPTGSNKQAQGRFFLEKKINQHVGLLGSLE